MILEPWAAWCLVAALLIDRFVIDPDRLWARLPHPVVGFGWLIDRSEAGLRSAFVNVERAKWEWCGGIAIVLLLLVASVAIGWLLSAIPVIGPAFSTLGAAILLAQRSLASHVMRVADGLERDIEAGRREVSMIVGRDVAALDEAGIARAATESLAENFSDGIVAPAIWYLIFGLPGVLAYKAVNTADSMIGHRSERFERLGWASARLDDLLNFAPARLTALMLAAVSDRPGEVLQITRRDAGLHRSPNAGWPEAAMAAALGIRLGGPRSYDGGLIDEPSMNREGRGQAVPADIRSALGLYGRALWLLFGLVLVVAVIGTILWP